MTSETTLDTRVQTGKVRVDLADRSYDIHIGSGLLGRIGDLIAPLLKRPKLAIVTDENVAEHHLARLEDTLSQAGIAGSSIIVPAGEQTKSFPGLAGLCDQLLEAGIERQDVVIAFGGGVIGDLAGFAAAVLRRGIEFIQIPTTLLAQVDSSVGGKTGINTQAGKNLIGAFHQPKLVVADIDLLDTLPLREVRAGYAEVAKYGLIDDPDFFAWLETAGPDIISGDKAARIRAVETSCTAKAAIVAADERESGARALLNLGHTFGHALESATGYSTRLLHGEGVSIGMVLAQRFSEHLGVCETGCADRVEGHLAGVGLPVAPGDIDGDLPGPEELLKIMYQDKKTVAGKLTFVLTRGVGQAYIAHDVAESDVLDFLRQNTGSK